MTPRRATGRHLVPVSVGFAAIALASTWPVAREATRSLPGDAGDPLLVAWILGWVADRLPHALAGVWTAPNFFPCQNTLAFSEHFLGIAPFVAPIVWFTRNPLLAYNVAFIASFALCGIGMYVLVVELTSGQRAVAWVTALAFTLAPSRMAQISHLQMLACGWMPLSLWSLHRYVRTSSWRALTAFIAFVLLQSLSNSYLVYFIAVPAAILSLHGLWLAGPARRRIAVGLAGAAAVIVLGMAPIAAIYFDVRHEYGMRRTEDDVANYGADLGAYLRGNDGLHHVIEPWRYLPNAVKPIGPEGQLFPGLVVLSLCVAGIATAWGRFDFSIGRVYTIVAVTAVWLSMGPWPTAWGVHVPIGGVYNLLFHHFPGFDGIRVPARLSVVALLAIDVLAAFGLVWIRQRFSARAATAITTAAIVGIVLEGVAAPLPTAFVGQRGRPEAAAYNWIRDHEAGPIVELPAGVAAGPLDAFRFQYQTLFHHHRIVNGSSGYDTALDGFISGPASPLLNPTEFSEAIRMLRAVGVRTVVVHPALFVDRDAEALTLEGLRNDPRQVIRETALPDMFTFALAPFSDAELATVPGMRLAAGRAGTIDHEVPLSSMRAQSSISPERLSFLFDHDLDSRWLTGGRQTGAESLDVEFDAVRDVSRIRIETSARSIGNYPRRLRVESLDDRGVTRLLFEGSVLTPLCKGLVIDSIREPIDLWLPANHTRRLRLQQIGQARTFFWAIDELKVYEAARTG